MGNIPTPADWLEWGAGGLRRIHTELLPGGREIMGANRDEIRPEARRMPDIQRDESAMKLRRGLRIAWKTRPPHARGDA